MSNKIPVKQFTRCPSLSNEGLCTIYDNRYSCCRNFPHKKDEGMFCNDLECVYDSDGNLDCFNCKDKCCNHLAMPFFDEKLMDMSCQECKEIYCEK